MSNHHLAAALTTIALFAAADAGADDLSAVSPANELYSIDSVTGAQNLVGTFTLAPGDFGLSHIARHPNGTLYGMSWSTSGSTLYQLDDQTAAASLLYPSGGPVTADGAAIDPTDGSFWYINSFGFIPWASLTRLDLQTGIESHPGFINPTGDAFNGLAFDGNGQMYSLNASKNALWRIDKNDPANNAVMVGTGLGTEVDLAQGATLSRNPATGQIVGYAASGHTLFTVDTTTGKATALKPTSPLTGNFVAIAAGNDFSGCGTVSSYGKGCAGSGGFVPVLTWSGCAAVGESVMISVEQGLGGSTALLLFGLGQGSTPIGGGCDLLVSPLLAPSLALPLGGTGFGNGSVAITTAMPSAASGAQFTLQSFVLDPASPIGAVGSNALDISIP